MEKAPSRRIVASALACLSTGAWILLAIAGAPAAHAQRMGNQAVDAALAQERARQSGTAANPVPPPAPTPAPRTGSAPVPTQPSQPAPTITSTLDVGSSGEQVKAVEQRLDALHYFVGAVDGRYDDDTYQAVMAFQKTNNLNRTGTVDQSVWSAITTAKDPSPLVPGGGSHRVEVDLGRQVLFLYEGGKLSKIIAVSSGTSDTPTPTGDYSIYRQASGWEESDLGLLYNSQYFTGGYAIHGSKSVPAEPASHGCVRIPMTAADWFPSHVSKGTPVFIR